MKKNDYIKLNKYLNDIFNYLEKSDKYLFICLNDIYNISKHINDKFSDLYFDEDEITNNLSFIDVIYHVENIIKYIDSKYIPIFRNVINNGELNFSYNKEEEGNYFLNKDDVGIINIDREYNYQDVINLSHEFGHYFVSKIFKWNIDKIYLYPFGGLIKYNEKIDKPFKEEFIISISGIISQSIIYFIFLFLYKNYIINHYFFNIIRNYNYSILLFNIIPIIPLDGSKVLNIILNKIFDFRRSYILLNIISIILLIIFIFNSNMSLLIVILFLIYKIYLNLKDRSIIFKRFILEKYLYDDYNKINYINNIKNMKRNKKNIKKHINNNMY